VADPEIAQLVQRLQTARERWYKRGREDGKRWAVQTPSREELYRAKDFLEGEDGAELADQLRRRHERLRAHFGGYDFEAAINRWVREDKSSVEFRIERHEHDEDDEDVSFRRAGSEARPDVDAAGYMEGWRDVLDEIWQVVSAALR